MLLGRLFFFCLLFLSGVSNRSIEVRNSNLARLAVSDSLVRPDAAEDLSKKDVPFSP